MKKIDFKKIRIIKEHEDVNNFNLKKDEIFLHGNKMINQLHGKQIGEEISYFICISSDEKGRYEYMPKYDVLEK